MANVLAVKFFEAMFKNSRFFRDKMHSQSRIGHLSILQVQTLSFLKHKTNAQMSEVAEQFRIELPSATSLLNKLVALQLVKRQQDEKDRRLVRVSLTVDGDKLLKQVMEEKIKQIEHMLSYLSKNEQEELLRLLEKLNTRIEKDEH
jgi:DNA-binding MarR family transcriptional regulator